MSSNVGASRKDLGWNSLLIILPPLIVLLVGNMLTGLYGPAPSIPQPTAVFDLAKDTVNAAAMLEAPARLKVLSMLTLMMTVAFGLVVYAYVDAYRPASPQARSVLKVAGGLLVLVALLVLWSSTLRISMPPLTGLVGQNVFDKAQQLVDRKGPEFSITTMVSLANGAVAMAVVAMIFSTISCLRVVADTEETDGKSSLDRLKLNTALATVMLTAGILFTQNVVHWPEFALRTENAKELSVYQQAFQNAGNAYVLFVGLEFSLVLAAYTLPAAAFLQKDGAQISRARVAEKRDPGGKAISAKEVADEQKKQGLYITILDQIKVLIAIVIPFLTGALPGLLDLLPKS